MATWQATIIPKQREKADPEFTFVKAILQITADDYDAAEWIVNDAITAQSLDGRVVIDELVEMAQ